MLSTALCSSQMGTLTILPRFEDVAHPLRFRLKLSLLQYEEVTFSNLSTWLRCFSSKRCFVAYEFVAGFTPIGYVCSANGMCIGARDPQRSSTRVYGCSVLVVKAVTLQKDVSVSNINWTLKSPIFFGLNCPLLCPALRVGFE
ncbi:hypothetical protein DY000_02009202 [Brassica cretica]|uniref:Uncharacterized protein n=1 Tax=Brassica cretica TaxID=69181 RepID=A0ABQ7C7G3_BRACR|nr:hypothetical protein DY000_02009202 [Brassica cretica]